jgi:hypothetical protein
MSWFHKLLFAEFKRNGIVMEQRLLKKIKGLYDTMWRDRYSHVLQFRDDFGTLLNQAAVDLKEEDKLRKYPWNLENYKHLMLLMVFRGMKLYLLRASKEVSRSRVSTLFVLFANPFLVSADLFEIQRPCAWS